MTTGALPDLLAPGLKAVFCGINPGRVSAAAGAHFANPRNDFWRLLHAAGLTRRLLAPAEQRELLRGGFGITNAAYRMTAGSGDLRRADFAGSAERLLRVAEELGPGLIAFVGKEAYRGVFDERPELGLQTRHLAGTSLFVLPSTSPANAAVPYAERLHWFRKLALLLDVERRDTSTEAWPAEAASPRRRAGGAEVTVSTVPWWSGEALAGLMDLDPPARASSPAADQRVGGLDVAVDVDGAVLEHVSGG